MTFKKFFLILGGILISCFVANWYLSVLVSPDSAPILFSSAQAATQNTTYKILPQGGSTFQSAPVISPGKYVEIVLDSKLNPDNYYKIPIKAGDFLSVQATFIRDEFTEEPDGCDYGAGLALYNSNEIKLRESNEWFMGGRNIILSGALLANSTQDVHESYLNIYLFKYGCSEAASDVRIKIFCALEVATLSSYDANTQIDAADNFLNSKNIITLTAPGQYQGYLSPKYTLGEPEEPVEDFVTRVGNVDWQDIYKVLMKPNQILTVRLIPSSFSALGFTIYDEAQNEMLTLLAPKKGAILTGSVESKRNNEAPIYIKILGAAHGLNMNYQDEVVSYTLELLDRAYPNVDSILIDEYPRIPPTDNDFMPLPPQSMSPFSPAEKSFVKHCLVVVGIVAAVLIIFFLLKKKKKRNKKNQKTQFPIS